MTPSFTILDERDVWWQSAIETAKKRGYNAQRIKRGDEADCANGLGFIRPHAEPAILKRNQDEDDPAMRASLTMVQDRAQVEVYENKSEQFRRWGRLMPPTWRFTDHDEARQFAYNAEYPLVSKADVGASSENVRVFRDRVAAIQHIDAIFGPGVRVNHCSGGRRESTRSLQRDYVLLQKFIPHTVTWRVNIIGNARAIFRRFNYPDRPVAQTGNVEPVVELDGKTRSLLECADFIAREVGTKWCALDILLDESAAPPHWYLLETSLGWPWPSPGTCNEAPFFVFSDGWRPLGRRWREMWEVLFDEYEAGTWAA